MGCLLWIQHLIDILTEFLQSFIQYLNYVGLYYVLCSKTYGTCSGLPLVHDKPPAFVRFAYWPVGHPWEFLLGTQILADAVTPQPLDQFKPSQVLWNYLHLWTCNAHWSVWPLCEFPSGTQNLVDILTPESLDRFVPSQVICKYLGP